MPPDPFATHIPTLVRALKFSDGPILEIGCGRHSTPLLHRLGEATGRAVTSLDTSAAWIAQLTPLPIRRVDSWDADDVAEILARDWGLVFVDCGPPARVRGRILAAVHHADVVVIHDTEERVRRFYGIADEITRWRFRVDDTTRVPHTSAVSDTVNLRNLVVDASWQR